MVDLSIAICMFTRGYPNCWVMRIPDTCGILWCLLGQLLGCPSSSSSSSSSSSLLSCSLFRPKFLQNEARVKTCIFYFCSSVPRFTPMNMHVRVRTHRLQHVFLPDANSWQHFAGEVLPAKCPAKFLSEEWRKCVAKFAAKDRQNVCFYVLFLKIPRNFTTNFTVHHSLGPKQNQAAKFSPSNIFIYIH